MSICNGAKVLAAAGLLDGRQATAHWYSRAKLAQKHPSVTWRRDLRWVTDGPITTTAGISAADPATPQSPARACRRDGDAGNGAAPAAATTGPAPPAQRPADLDKSSPSERLRIVEAAVRNRIVEPGEQARVITAARTRLATWLERGTRFEPRRGVPNRPLQGTATRSASR